MSEGPRFAPNGNRLPERLPIGHRLVDTTKQQWLIGPTIGCGGFGDIYLTRQYDENIDDLKRLTQEHIVEESKDWNTVVKFEHFSGPLFAEINFYLRCARKETIEEYMAAKKLKHLGMPRFVASGIYDPIRIDNPPPICRLHNSSIVKTPAAKRGRQTVNPTNGVANGKKSNGVVANGKQRKVSTQSKEKKYRFLVLQRFGDDIQKIWTRADERFDMKSAFNIALKVIDTLEYIHSHGYVHADVKASNLLVETWQDCDNKRSSRVTTKSVAVKRGRPKSVTNGYHESNGISNTSSKGSIEDDDQIYLIDYGLVERFYSKDGTHRENVEDQRRANNGTVEFSSRDAHIGAFSRRSDLESLAYNILYWVSGGRLPWTNVLKDHQLVEASKRWYMDNLEIFVNYCFNEDAHPIDPLKLLRGLDPSDTNNSSKSSSMNGRTNGRSNHSVKNNTSTISTTSTKASTVASRNSSRSSTKSKAPASKSSSSTTSSSSSHDSIMCAALYDFLSYITKLSFEEEPDYYLLRSILTNALGTGSSARKARKRVSQTLKKTPPKLPKCENPTPAMREILRKMSLGKKN